MAEFKSAGKQYLRIFVSISEQHFKQLNYENDKSSFSESSC